MSRVYPLILGLFVSLANAESSTSGDANICYLPTQSNVSYSELIDLPVDSPAYVLAYGDQSLQYGELWLPKSESSSDSPIRRHPLVVLIHGGCWLNSYDIRHTHALSSALSQAGYAVWSIEYRRTGDEGGGWPGSYDDIKSAIRYLPKLANYPVDLERLALAGHSAGGHLALLAGADELFDFKAVIGLAAIVDLPTYSVGNNSCQLATPQFMGGTVDSAPAAYELANPMQRTLSKSTVLLHGLVDSIVPSDHALNAKVRHRLIDDAGHFDMIHPGTLSYQALLRELAKAFSDK